MKNAKKIVSLLLALAMVVTMLPATLAVEPDEWVKGDVIVEKVENPGVDLKQGSSLVEETVVENPYSPNDIVRVIVVLEGKSLLEQGFTATQISANSGIVTKQLDRIKAQQETVINRVESVVAGLELNAEVKVVKVRNTFNVASNGFSLDVPYAALSEIAKLDGVKSAFLAPQYTVPEDQTDETLTPSMVSTSGHFGSAQTWTDLGYTGEGMRVAIVDTGLDTDHPSFVDDPVLTETSLTVEEIAEVLPRLHAYEMYGAGLTAEDLYISGKIPFAFNYKDVNLDPTHDNDLQGDHGSHVAGIVAANKIDTTDVVGVAPDAQVIVMKVFGANGGPYADDIAVVLEDCILLNVDAVNMSLGSTAGFTSLDTGYEWIQAIYDSVEEHDMILSISAGNEYSSAYNNTWGTNTNLTTDPDNGLVGSPGTWGGTMVASMENTHFMIEYMTLGDRQMIYYDATYAFAYTLAPTEDVDYQYVMVPGVGTEEDFAQVDVAGKIAVVSRGIIDFTSKQLNAANAGAIACIVHDNVHSDEILYMMDGGYLPNVFITLADGEAMAAAADENGVGTVTINAYGSVTSRENPYAGQMSDFSSWGGTPDLQLAPDVTAPGGNIYSCYTDGQYGMMSGTSMSAPHIAGMAALVLQHIHETYPELDDAAMHNLAEALIMSTATPVTEYNTGVADVPYSPRKQGAGEANVYDAITSSGYLTVDGDKPKVSLGDDDEKSGVYTFSFEINNLSNKDKSYTLDASVLTDYVNDLYNYYYGLPYFMGEMSMPLTAEVQFLAGKLSDEEALLDVDGNGRLEMNDVQCLLDAVNGLYGEDVYEATLDLNGDGELNTVDAQALYEVVLAQPEMTETNTVVVPAGGFTVVDVEITLSDEDRAYMDAYYPNGIYVEGFVRCLSADGDSDLSLPFMGFYGDWSEAGEVFDSGWHWQTEEELWYERYINVLFTNYYGMASYGVLGGNPYMDEPYDPSQNVLSPNGDGYQDVIDDIYLGMMRGAKQLSFNWVTENGEALAGVDLEYVNKSYYSPSYGVVLPFIWSWYMGGTYDYTDENGEYLPSGTKLDLVIDAYLDDGDWNVDDNITVPIIIDTVAPAIVDGSVEYLYSEKRDARLISFDVADDYDIAALIPLTQAGDPIEFVAVDGVKSEDGETQHVTLDVSDYDSTFVICVADYGLNESYYQITFAGKNNVSFDKFYGYRQASVYEDGVNLYLVDGFNGWYSFESADAMLQHTSMYNDGETAVMAAEYIDGYVIGIDAERNIFAMKAGDWTRMDLGVFEVGYYECPALDMAYDYTTDTLYVLTDESSAGAGGHLVSLDYMTGEVTDLGVITMPEGHAGQLLTLACDNDGVLYAISYVGDPYAETYEQDTGDLYIVDVANRVEAEDWWDDSTVPVTYVGETGYVPELYQSMTVDHQTNELYWAAYPGYYSSYNGAFLLNLDKSTGAIKDYTMMDEHSEMTALFKPYDSGADIIPDAELEAVVLSADALAMGINTAAELVATPWPYNAELGELVWTSSDESVAVVFDGVVYALAEGTACITATTASGVSAECTVDVVNLNAELTVFDMGSDFMWQNFSVTDPASAEYLDAATSPYNGVTAAAYFNGSVYASEQMGGFYRLDAETMQGEAVGSPNVVLVAMAFNYADGFMYAIQEERSMMSSANYVVRVNLSNGQVEKIATFGDVYSPLGGMAIDYEGNFYSYCGNNETWGYELVKWTVEDGAMVPVQSWAMDEWQSYNYSSMTYSAEDNGIYWIDAANNLYWIDMDSLTEENYVPRVVYTGTVPTAMGSTMSMGMFTVPAEELEVPFVAPETVEVPVSYVLLEGGSVSANVVVNPWNSYPEITYAIADENVATVDAGGTISGVAEGETTLTVTVEGCETVYEIPVKVAPAAGYINGYLISDFMYGSNLVVNFSDLDPTTDFGVLGYVDAFNLFAGAYYDGKIYAYGQDNYGDYDYKSFFLTIDAGDFEVTMGEKIHYTLRDMAVDYTTGNLYAIAEDGALAGAVAVVDPETGAVTIVGDTGKALAALTVDAEGNMYAIGEDGNLYLVNKDTAELTLVGSVGVAVGAVYQSMHYDLNTGNTYWAHVAPDQTSSLRLVDLETGATSSLGTICPSGAMISAMYTVPGAEPTEPDMDNVQVTGIQLTKKAAVTVGESIELTATVLTAVELAASEIRPMGVGTPSLAPVDVTVEWTSSDESVATVDENGVVTGVAAGTAVITASAGGFSAECEVVVTAEARKFYAYDKSNTQWISFTEGDGEFQQIEKTDYWGDVSYEDVWFMNTTVERDDAEGEAPILASTYTGETIYAYDVEGKFYTVDPETFERTYLGNGICGESIVYMVTGFDYWSGTEYSYEVECEASVVDIAYDCVTDKLYAVVSLVNEEEWVEAYSIYEVNAADGTITVAFESAEIKPANLYVENGVAYFVDAYMSGMLYSVNLNAAEPAAVEIALTQGYWGDVNSSVSLIKDYLTGQVYAIRDLTDTAGTGYYDEEWNYIFTPWDGVTGDATLCTYNLSDADIAELGRIGANLVVNGLFIR